MTATLPQDLGPVITSLQPTKEAVLRIQSLLIAAQRAEHADTRRVPLGCLARLQQAFDAEHPVPDHGRGRATASQGIVEPLTRRELEVLGMLAAGRSNRAIADQLVVTLDTVKKHVSHVLDKLGAANRTEAVARAQQLGLIP